MPSCNWAGPYDPSQQLHLCPKWSPLLYLAGTTFSHCHAIGQTASERRLQIIYRHQRSYFVDALTKSYGIRRLWLSPVSIRLLHAIKANEAPADFNSIESFATHFANRALPGNSAGGVGFIQSCMQAFLFFRVPSLLHSWMRGTLFARTVDAR